MALHKDVCIGQVWIAKVSQKLTEVEIISVNEGKPKGYDYLGSRGYKAWLQVKNLRTGRVVEMTAAKLRKLVKHSTVSAPADIETAALDILKRMGG